MLTKIKSMREEGFTLVELLVVIVILVALAAIAIPVFLNQQANANDAARQQTVASIAAFVNSGIANGSLDDTASPVTDGVITSTVNGSITVPADYTATWDSTTGAFCVGFEDPADATVVYSYSNTSGAVVTEACA